MRARQAVQRAQAAEVQAALADQSALEFANELDNVYKSLSWRITAPIRSAANLILKRRFPSLSKPVEQANKAPIMDERLNSPGTRRIFADLKAAISDQQEKDN